MFCTIQDIKDIVPANMLAELTGGNDNQIAKAISLAEATINAYISGSYNPQNSSGAEFLGAIAEKIAVYNIYVMSACDETPQIVTASYSEAISDLEKIQKGFISLTDSQNSQIQRQSEVYTNKDDLDRLFPPDGFKGF